MLALVLYGLSVKRMFLLFCPVELESIRLKFLVMLIKYFVHVITVFPLRKSSLEDSIFYFVDLES